MKLFEFACGACGGQISLPLQDSFMDTKCPACLTELKVEVFPAFFWGLAPGHGGETLVVSDESSCFYHADKKAVVHCEGCGRFLCGLCDVEFHNRHLCASCIEVAMDDEKAEAPVKERMYYDSMALSLAVVPLIPFLLFFTVFTAPTALYLSIRHWNTPMSVLPRGRWRFVIAIIVSLLQITAWIGGIATMVLFS